MSYTIEDQAEDEEKVQEEGSESEVLQNINMGDSNYFCPVSLSDRNILWPCNGDIRAAYREKVYFFSSEEALEKFLASPQSYVAKKKPLKIPPIRLLIAGPVGSGKTTLARHLTNKIGLCHIQFQEYLHEIIIKKTKKKITFGIDFADSETEDFDMLEGGFNKKFQARTHLQERSACLEYGELSTKDELISNYLSASNLKDKTLPDDVLLEVFDEFWKGKRFRTTGFVLEGFPSNEAEVIQMGRLGLYPSAALFLNVDADEAVKRLLPERIRKWKIKQHKKQEFKRKLREYYVKERSKAMEARKKQLLEQKADYMKKLLEMRKEFNVMEEEEEDDSLDLKEYEENIRQSIINWYEFEQEEKIKILIICASSTLLNNMKMQNQLKKMLVSTFELDTNKRLTTVTYQLNKKLKPFLEKFRSLFEHVSPISLSLAEDLLRSGYKHLSRFDRWCPVMLAEGSHMQQDPSLPRYPAVHRAFIYFLSSQEALRSFVRDPLHYLCSIPSKMVVPVNVAVIGPPRSGKTTIASRLANDLVIARISAGDALRQVLQMWPTCFLSKQIFSSLNQGSTVPDALTAKCLNMVLMDPLCAIRGYALDGYPMTIDQIQAIEARDIQPLRIIYLKISKEQLAHHWQLNRDNRLQTLHEPLLDDNEFLENRLKEYLLYEPAVRGWYKEGRNILHEVPLERSRWWVWSRVVDVIMNGIDCVRHHAEGLSKDGVASIVGLGITPQEFRQKLGPCEEYCPVSLIDKGELIDCSRQKTIEFAAEFKDVYYRLAGESELATFLNNHLLYVRGRPVPPKQCRPVRRSREEAQAMFGPKQGLLGFCPVTYHQGDFMYHSLIRGYPDHAVEYMNTIYYFTSEDNLEKFMRKPKMYHAIKNPTIIPPDLAPLSATSLPIPGYLEQKVSHDLIKALTACGNLKPKYPFLSAQKSAIIYVGLYLKAHNALSSVFTRRRYHQKLKIFEERCDLIRYLSLNMGRNFKEGHERPAGFDAKLKDFFRLQGVEDVRKSKKHK
ncbi:hypothetical protein HELRODRAFT_85518 [Helobdella robusta]|uniref:Nucleoside-diphosphate kinase n=1 Tax=Helobdella robusta TaxID=6412 RepID=T1G5Y4_HELRO|nr:hypothetical protein HELRODRAFT_85518 [Helobdella robusta]ESN97356.1 hypothetical protein HELRODRAFT_85518 [Helobdella robusta]